METLFHLNCASGHVYKRARLDYPASAAASSVDEDHQRGDLGYFSGWPFGHEQNGKLLEPAPSGILIWACARSSRQQLPRSHKKKRPNKKGRQTCQTRGMTYPVMSSDRSSLISEVS